MTPAETKDLIEAILWININISILTLVILSTRTGF